MHATASWEALAPEKEAKQGLHKATIRAELAFFALLVVSSLQLHQAYLLQEMLRSPGVLSTALLAL